MIFGYVPHDAGTGTVNLKPSMQYAHLQNRLGGKWPANVNNCGERLASVEDDIALQLDSAAEFAETDPGNTLFCEHSKSTNVSYDSSIPWSLIVIWLGTYDCL